MKHLKENRDRIERYKNWRNKQLGIENDTVKLGFHQELRSVEEVKNVVGSKAWSCFTNNNEADQEERWQSFFNNHDGFVSIMAQEDENEDNDDYIMNISVEANSNQEFSDDITSLEVYLDGCIRSELNVDDEGYPIRN